MPPTSSDSLWDSEYNPMDPGTAWSLSNVDTSVSTTVSCYDFHTCNSFMTNVGLLSFYTPPLKCGEVLCYTLRCLSVCPSVRPSVPPSVRPSVRPCSPFPIDNLSIYSRNFFKFCIHIVIGDEWYGIVNGQNPSIFNGVTALFRIGKMVSGLLFLYYS